MGVRNTELTDEREDPYVIWNNGKGTPLGHYLLYVKEGAGPIHVTYHQGEPVAISVESELRITGPLKSNGPQNFFPILLIEIILRVKEEEAPLLLLEMLPP